MRVSERLLRWYRINGRDLPWRRTTDPYRILVSEIMLQQTQVARVLEFYPRWLKEFPNWKALASASSADVIYAWAGLGYNRRALVLRDIAISVQEKGIPQSRDEWLALKGIGPYTSAVLTVFSLQKRASPIDTNIRRVLGRIFFQNHYPQLTDDPGLAVVMTDKLMTHKDFVHIPQAIFDLANTHCTKTPSCATCPMKDVCSSSSDFLTGRVEVPKRMTAKPNERIHKGKNFPDRIYRGRILKLVREEQLMRVESLGKLIDKGYLKSSDRDWLEAMLLRLEKDGLIAISKNGISLPRD
jgi:A/G-specific adenine glycosylase